MLKLNAAKVRKMAEICAKPDVSEKVKFILIQHVARNAGQHRKEIWAERRTFSRQAGIFEVEMPGAPMQIAELKQRAKDHRRGELDQVDNLLAGIGNMLLHDRGEAFEKIGLCTLLDLLSINPVHRHGLDISDLDRGLAELVYVERLENSADRSSNRWGEGGPLFEACFAAVSHWLRTAPKEDLPDLFGPGSPFAGAQVVRIDSLADITGPSSETLQ
ncbi:hypothetical protein [Pseudomonas sp. p99-361]|uniref:hypothetical protein n=1 Tax=Pseudomonas sp. p99-361 TaxID=2479852 RepID=UPI000F7A70C5|nr:hypothetical protein [Pseudomonas sp. p99-361]RRV55491.1 hypothetical protein EGJ15_24470 [Pseudomonas sp. p99-361]